MFQKKYQKAENGEFYNLDKAVKVVKEKDRYKVTFEVSIKLGKYKSETNIQKYFDELVIPEKFKKIDENLYLNFDKVLRVNFFDEYCYLTSLTKKKIGKKYLNYNIKATGKNEEIKKIIEGESMWIKVNNSYINTSKITNVYLEPDNNKMIFNFVNHTSNMLNIEDVKPEFEVEILSNEDFDAVISEILSKEGWIPFRNKLINLNNVYNVKILPIPDQNKFIVFVNFISNISKNRDDGKVISTEFIKCVCDTQEEVDNLVNKLI